MRLTMLSETEEEILEAIWKSSENDAFSIDAVRRKCHAECTDGDIERLQQQGLIVRSGDRILFSADGKRQAQGIIRRHRLAEVLVTSVLKLKQADMEEIACKVEHSLLPEVEEAICTLLGHPDICPDGKPIPRGSCCQNGLTVVDQTVVSLTDLRPSESGKITYIKPGTHSNLHRLMSLGLHPGALVTVHRRAPAFCIKFENTELALDEEIAKNIFVWKVSESQTSQVPEGRS